mgnify:CR=1 FL=1
MNRENLKSVCFSIAICNSAIEKFPESIGAKKCAVLIEQIQQPNLHLQAEEFIGINSPSRTLVTYKNLEKLDFKIYKISNNQLKRYNNIYRTEEKEAFFKKLNPIETFSSALKTEGDYQNHSTEIVIPNLANGLYLIKANTATKDNVFATTHIQVTDLVLVESYENIYTRL